MDRTARPTRRIRRGRIVPLAVALLAAAGLAACEPPPPPTAFTVTRVADGPDASPGDGVCEVTAGAGDCSLRAAVEEGNAVGGPIEIGIDVPSHLTVTVPTDLTVATTTTIDGHGAAVSARFVHTTGVLVLRNITDGSSTPVPFTTCGSSLHSTGDGVVLDRVEITGTMCTSGFLVIHRSELYVTGEDAITAGGSVHVAGSFVNGSGDQPSLRSVGDGPLTVSSSIVLGIEPGTSSGRIAFSWVSSARMTPELEVAASMLSECLPGSVMDSRGYNLDEDGTCGADDATDQVVDQLPEWVFDPSEAPPMQFVPVIGSIAVGAVPAGTPGLCDGTWPTDSRGEPRTGERPCDIGPYQTQASVDVVGSEEHLAGVADLPVRVNASGTVGLTFEDASGVRSAGTWASDGTATDSGIAGSEATDISDDGVVVGRIDVDGRFQPWQWTPGEGPAVVAGPTGADGGELLAIDDVDGTVVGRTDDAEPILWYRTPDGPATTLPSPAGATVTSIHDGIAVGSRTAGTGTVAVRWDLAAGTAEDLPDRDDGYHPSWDGLANDIADDGTIVGQSKGAARWRPGQAPTEVGTAFGSQQILATTGGGDLFVSEPYSERTCSSTWWCNYQTIVPAGTRDHRPLVVPLPFQDLGDDGSLVGVRRVSGSGSTATFEVVRVRIAIGA